MKAIPTSKMLFLLCLFVLSVLAQRPDDQSQCDYYAVQLYGTNTTETQFTLVQSIVALAFAGGSNVSNVSSEITGIWNPGTFQSLPVDLGLWFNGSNATTNLNGQASGVNWLNGGGNAPLQSFLTEQTPSIEMANNTNEYQFLIHQYSAFSRVIACSLPTPLPPSSGGTRNLAYVHKFMDLTSFDIGHFINQLALSAVHFGFSQQDSDQISQTLNVKFNNRCSPPDSTGQLYSLCQDASCPIASDPDCSAYLPENLGVNGAISSSVTGTATSASTPTSASTSPATTSPATPTPSPSKSSGLSTGGIVGIAIGGAALTFGFVLALVFLLRKKRNGQKHQPQHEPIYQPSPSFPPSSVAYTDPHSSYISQQRVSTWNGSPMETWNEPQMAEMEHPGSPGSFGQAHHTRSELEDPGSPDPTIRDHRFSK